MIVIDEYLAVDVLRGNWPDGLPDDDQRFAGVVADLGITTTILAN